MAKKRSYLSILGILFWNGPINDKARYFSYLKSYIMHYIFVYFKRKAIANAFQYWANEGKRNNHFSINQHLIYKFYYFSFKAPLTFTEVCQNCKSDFTIDFGRHRHGSCSYPFDGSCMYFQL